ncbi:MULTISPECIES: alpha-L-fucosidase [Streptomyces]|uniref:alpha-L-fucosidase n=1 Tax=Streptomyces TaxID=1883 RepID=UPI0035A8940B
MVAPAALLLVAGGSGAAAARSPRPAEGPGTHHATDDPFTAPRTAWWRTDRFGVFLHFGAYSNLEGECRRLDGTVCRNAEWIERECGILRAE